MVAEIRGALDSYPREQLQEILAWVFKEYVVEGGAAPAASALAMLDARTELEGLSFAELVTWLQLHLDVPELAALEVQGNKVQRRARRAHGSGRSRPRRRRRSTRRPPLPRRRRSSRRPPPPQRCRRRIRRRRRTRLPPAPAPNPAPAAEPQSRREEGRVESGVALLVARGRLMSAPSSRAATSRAAKEQLRAGDLDAATQSFGAAVELAPYFVEARVGAALTLARTNPPRAAQLLRTGLRGLTRASQRRLVLVALGDVLTVGGDFPGADEAYAQASQLPGRHPLASRLARLQAKTGRYAEALATLAAATTPTRGSAAG